MIPKPSTYYLPIMRKMVLRVMMLLIGNPIQGLSAVKADPMIVVKILGSMILLVVEAHPTT